MNTNIEAMDEEQALARLLGIGSGSPERCLSFLSSLLARLLGIGSGSPVATPEMLMRMAQWLHATLKREIDARPARGKQEWGRVSDIMEIYGASRAQVNCWMVRLRAEGKVRVQNPISGAQGVGDTFYNLADIARAYEENAKRISRK